MAAKRQTNSEDRHIYRMRCGKTAQQFLIETVGAAVVNFVPVTDEDAERVQAERTPDGLTASSNLRACQWCGGRRVSGCTCQTDHSACVEKGVYRYQCLFCKELSAVRVGGDLKSLRINVTSPRYDDIGAILGEINLQYRSFNNAGFDCDVLFINCGTHDAVNPARLRAFVEGGGSAYISDLAYRIMLEAFPGIARIDANGKKGIYSAHVDDRDLRRNTSETIRVNYDLDNWAVIRHHQGTCLIKGNQNPYRVPMMFSHKIGSGEVFYTSFHNHAQATLSERSMLQVMLMRQIGSAYNVSVQDVSELLGLNITDIRARIRGG